MKATGNATVGGHQITADEIRIRYNTKTEGDNQYEAGSEGSLLVLLNLSLTQEMKDEGVAREFIARCQVIFFIISILVHPVIQKLKKKAGLVPTDEVTIFYDLKEGYLSSVVKAHLENITTAVRANVVAGRVFKIPQHHLIHISNDITCTIS